jgi:anti-anti-sigma regulatory factor
MTNTMSAMIGGCDLRVDRGPNWLLVRVRSNHDGSPDNEPLAERLWHLMEEHFVYRLALELDEVEVLDNLVIRQLGRLDHLARDHGGFVRLCGLSRHNWQRVVRNGLGNVFYPYGDRKEAVFASHPTQELQKEMLGQNAEELSPCQGTRWQNAGNRIPVGVR